jgi:hypothetical protein
MVARLPLITFDVNETLLDLESVAPIFLGPQPEVSGSDLNDVADQLIARYAG